MPGMSFIQSVLPVDSLGNSQVSTQGKIRSQARSNTRPNTQRWTTITCGLFTSMIATSVLTGCETFGSKPNTTEPAIAATITATQPLESNWATGWGSQDRPPNQFTQDSTFADGPNRRPLSTYQTRRADSSNDPRQVIFSDTVGMAEQRAQNALAQQRAEQRQAQLAQNPSDANNWGTQNPNAIAHDANQANPPQTITIDPQTLTSDTSSSIAANNPNQPNNAASFASREQLLQQTLEQIKQVDSTAFQKAIDQSLLAAALNQPFDPAPAGLTTQQHQLVKAYQALLISLNHGVHDNTSTTDLNAKALLASLQANEPAAVEIKNLQLCQSVTGYGQYQPINQSALLAGQPNPMVVYTELDGFESKLMRDGQYETRVSQEIKLYHATDDIVVWEEPAQVLTDLSRNKRRDFFLVQTITLPANVGNGRYQLKVTVVDHHSDTMWEQTVPIQLVADSDLVTAENHTSNDAWGNGDHINQ